MCPQIRTMALGFLLLGCCASPGLAQAVNEEPRLSAAEVLEHYDKKNLADPDPKVQFEAEKKAFTALKGDLSGFTPNKIVKGNPTPADERILRTGAKYFIYRVTWSDYANNQQKLATAIQDFQDFYVGKGPTPRGFGAGLARNANPMLSDIFHEELVDCFEKIFEREFLKNPLTTMNAAQMLAMTGHGKNEKMCDFLVKIIKSPDPKRPYHDAIKLFALRALKDYFPLKAANARDQLRIETLTEFIEKKRAPSAQRAGEHDKDYKARVKRELAAFTFIRKEAIQSLAHAEVPAANIGNGGIQGQVAVTLMKILAKDQLEPAPTLLEKCHAAWGLCNIKPDPGYQPDLAVYMVGRCFEEFVEAYQADMAKLNVNKDVKKVARHHWRLEAEHWREAMKNLEINAGSQEAATLKNIASGKKGILDRIVAHGTIDPGQIAELRKANSARPAVKTLFKVNKAPELDVGP